MSSINFTRAELAEAITRGVRQCVVIGSRPMLRDAFTACPHGTLQVFAVDEEELPDSGITFIPTQFESEPLATALENTAFDKLKASLFVWLGGAGYRTVDHVIASLAFIASLPKGSGVVFDYTVERSSLGSLTYTALDALASRIAEAGGSVRHFIQPQAVATMLRSLGFRQVLDMPHENPEGSGHLVSATV